MSASEGNISKHGEDRRRCSRVAFDSKVTLLQNDQQLDTFLIDVSLKGALVTTPKVFEIRTDQKVQLHIHLDDNTSISMNTTLVHNSSSVLGFRCESIDMDSIAHLRRIIECNLQDPNTSERVLDELINACSANSHD